MPRRNYETVKQRIAALLEADLEFLELDFSPTGSITLEVEGYAEVKTSSVLPNLKVALLTRCIEQDNQAAAIGAFRRGLRSC